MSVQFLPLRNYVLLDVEPEPEMSSVIQVQKATEGLVRFATITAIGPDVKDAQVGQRVMASLTAGVEMEWGTLIQEPAILGLAG
jgi:hypothetical protein